MSMSQEAREARNAYNRAYYAKNREKIVEQTRARRERFFENKAQAARIEQIEKLKAGVGLTEEQAAQALRIIQEGAESAEVEQQPCNK